MKQSIIVGKTILFFLFILGFCKYSQAVEEPIYTNWYNSMTQHGLGNDDFCVEVLADNLIMFDLTVRFADPNVKKYPAMKFYYNDVLNGNTGFTGPITNAMVQPAGYICGVQAWQATFTIVMNMANQCAISSLFCAEMNIQLVTDEDPKNMGITVAYPFLDNPGLFPTNMFDISGNNGRSNYWQIFKEICCEIGGPTGPGDPCNGLNGEHVKNNGISPFQPPVWLVGNTDDHFSQNQISKGKNLQKPEAMEVIEINLHDIHASPNPFKDQVKLKLKAKELKQVNIDCFDINGRTMHLNATKGSEYIYFETSGWMPGIYYLRLRNPNGAKTIKLLKME